ncbi:hypothetical protein NESM_000684300 [Novymonas esmeraldas]|uniref:Uncharacterized protein n=1 Tax=Novymonas esmeraldas TaxID=1808958 RepID=A0AAW0EWT0_9TRYP
MRHHTALVAAVVVVALLHATLFVPTAVAAASAPRAAATGVQHKRLQSFAAYAERVGAALELLTGKYSDTDDGTDGATPAATGAADALDEERFGGTSASGPTSHLAYAAQLLQYPHGAVQSAVESVARRATAARTFASVLVGAALDSDATALLAKVEADADRAPFVADTRVLPSERAPQLTAARAALQPLAPHVVAPAPQPVANMSRDIEALAWYDPEQTPIACSNGYPAYASNANVICENSYRRLTAGEYASLSPREQQWCNGRVSSWPVVPQVCVCPADFYLEAGDDGAFYCNTRPVDVQVTLEAKHLCHSEADEALGLPGTTEGEYCIKAARHDTLVLPVTWQFAQVSDNAMLAATKSINQRVPPQTPPGPGNRVWVVVRPRVAVSGTYSELTVNTRIFSYLVGGYAGTGTASPTPGDVGFFLSGSTALRSATAFTATFCFHSPRLTRDQLKEVSLANPPELLQYFGSGSGTTSHSLTLDLASIPDDFVEGNQMYVETGLKGGPSIYSYRVARIHVSFTDLAEPSANSHKYPRQFNPLYILLIAAIAAVVVGTGLAVLWYYCMQNEDYDDRLVSDAQRKKAQKTQSATN